MHDYLDLWSYDGTLDRIHHALYVECRERGKREASPTAAIIDKSNCVERPRPGIDRAERGDGFDAVMRRAETSPCGYDVVASPHRLATTTPRIATGSPASRRIRRSPFQKLSADGDYKPRSMTNERTETPPLDRAQGWLPARRVSATACGD